MEQVAEELLLEYGLELERFEYIGSDLLRVFASGQIFVLQASHEERMNQAHWLELYERKLPAVIPIFQTKQQAPALKSGGKRYVLHPELTNDEADFTQLTSHLAQFHQSTRRVFPVDEGYMKAEIGQLRTRNQEYGARALAILESCEQEVYMSPFALQYCLNYNFIKDAIALYDQVSRQCINKMSQDELWSESMIHLNLSKDCFVAGPGNYGFIRFGQVDKGSAILDLTQFFKNELKVYQNFLEMTQYEELFTYYVDNQLLTNLERSLLILNCLDLSEFINLAEDYYERNLAASMLETSVKQTHALRLIQLGARLARTEEQQQSTARSSVNKKR